MNIVIETNVNINKCILKFYKRKLCIGSLDFCQHLNKYIDYNNGEAKTTWQFETTILSVEV